MLFRPTREKLITPSATDSEERLFLIGGCVYIGTFIIASNWDYRLIFLLLCVPLLMKLEVKSLRYGLGVLLIFAMNYMLMNALLGKLGVAVNIFSKIFLFVVIFAMILLKLKVILENKRACQKFCV